MHLTQCRAVSWMAGQTLRLDAEFALSVGDCDIENFAIDQRAHARSSLTSRASFVAASYPYFEMLIRRRYRLARRPTQFS